MNSVVIAEQIEWLEHEIAATSSTVENLRRNGGYAPWDTADCEKTTLQLLEEQLRDERQLLADFQQLQHISSKRRDCCWDEKNTLA